MIMEKFKIRELDKSKTKGIVYICFGKQYDLVGSYSSITVRKNSDIPIYVITNVPEKKRSKKWINTNIEVMYLDWPDNRNREVKTKLYDYSPFDYTLHIDADMTCNAVKSFLPFKYLSRWDMVSISWGNNFNPAKHPWDSIAKNINTSKHSIPAGCCLFFAKNAKTKGFFNLWNYYWEEEGRLRDMGALFKAVWMSEIRMLVLPQKYWLDSSGKAYFSHSGDNERIKGLPKIVKFKPNSYKTDGKWKKKRK